jgi:hypothetical protein
MTGGKMEDWDSKSEADHRRWAIESVAMRVIGSDATLDELLVLSQKLVDFIDSGLPPDRRPSAAQQVPRESEDSLSRPLREVA